MKPGDKVNWLYEPRGGYGYSMNVAAVVEKVGEARAKIRVARRINGAWTQETRWVSKDRLSPRFETVPEVDVRSPSALDIER